jgi:hypothetical protein
MFALIIQKAFNKKRILLGSCSACCSSSFKFTDD